MENNSCELERSLSKKTFDALGEALSDFIMKVERISNNTFSSSFREDLNSYFRSNWEANFARICKFECLNWEYEPETFTLNSGKTYTPDFKVGDTYYEIKGKWIGDSKEKFDNFILENAECKIILVDGKIYKQLKNKYKHLITWEGK